MDVYLSHLGEPELRQLPQPFSFPGGTLSDLIEALDAAVPGAKSHLIGDDGALRSAAVVYTRVERDAEGRLLDTDGTRALSSLRAPLTEDDGPLLVSVFHPERLMDLLAATLGETEERLDYGAGTREYRGFLQPVAVPEPSGDGAGPQWFAAAQQPLYPFTEGSAAGTLVADDGIRPMENRLIPRALLRAVAALWEIEDHDELKLRRFQEDALRHILTELHRPQGDGRPLLLSIPTGGGKTEAFLIPLVAHLQDVRARQKRPRQSVRALVMYPTRALANDQARRVAEVLYHLNQQVPSDRAVSVGLLTGDTPSSNHNFRTENSLLQLCPKCGGVLTQFEERTLPGSTEPVLIATCSCGAETDFFRLTRRDILRRPPDLLITSPDMVNRMLQSPRFHDQLFSSDLDVVVFDEIHVYEGVFGCNVAHLLRRLETACHKKPLYVGVSATIRNAKELACLLFDAALDETLYLRPRQPEEPETDELRSYLDYERGPVRFRHHYAVKSARKNVTATLNAADVIGHAIRDPHFRKTLIFANYRGDTDDVVRYLRDQEDRYYRPYHQQVFPKVQAARQKGEGLSLSSTEAGIAAALGRWYEQIREQGHLHAAPLALGWHRGGLERDERIAAVNRFSATARLGNGPDAVLPIDVMVATRTLELGIDIGDVTTVVNNGAPLTTNEYAQRVGRGGRKRDAMALTVLSSGFPMDAYFLRHFQAYATPRAGDFEDAPVIVSNPDVLRAHILARLLDWAARELGGDQARMEITAADLADLPFYLGVQRLTLRTDPQAWGGGSL